MIYWELLLGFLKVGCFSFGGAYGAIPLIRDVVRGYGWLGDDALTYMIAVSESTPGPIMVNMATYVGSSQAGFWGAAAATAAVVLPAFTVILLVMRALKRVWNNPWVQAALRGVKPCVTGIILGVGSYMMLEHCFPGMDSVDLPAILITALLLLGTTAYKKLGKKKLSPIALILISAVLGMVMY